MNQKIIGLSPKIDLIKIGVLGCGEHACRAHTQHLTGDAHTKVLAAYDPHEQRAAATGASIKCQNEEDLWLSEINAVIIATPDDKHFANLERAIEAKKHIFIEKPLAVNPEELAKLPDLLAKATELGLVITSCHPRRFDKPYQWLQAELPLLVQRFGSIIKIELDFSYHTPEEAWKHQRSLLLDHGNHEFDYLNFLLGLQPCQCQLLQDSHDYYHVNGQRSDGINFEFIGTRRLSTRRYPEYIRLRFARAFLEINTALGYVRIDDHETGKIIRMKIGANDYVGRFQAVNENFLGAIRGHCRNYLSTADLPRNTAFGIKLLEGRSWGCL